MWLDRYHFFRNDSYIHWISLDGAYVAHTKNLTFAKVHYLLKNKIGIRILSYLSFIAQRLKTQQHSSGMWKLISQLNFINRNETVDII